jgi:hypothetical protein
MEWKDELDDGLAWGSAKKAKALMPVAHGSPEVLQRFVGLPRLQGSVEVPAKVRNCRQI